jgi:hypothetical protein
MKKVYIKLGSVLVTDLLDGGSHHLDLSDFKMPVTQHGARIICHRCIRHAAKRMCTVRNPDQQACLYVVYNTTSMLSASGALTCRSRTCRPRPSP